MNKTIRTATLLLTSAILLCSGCATKSAKGEGAKDGAKGGAAKGAEVGAGTGAVMGGFRGAKTDKELNVK